MKEKHETLMEIAGETISNFFAITNTFTPDPQIWDKQVLVRVVERKKLKQQTKCGLSHEEGHERRCGGNSTIIDPDPNLEEILRIWAKITDSIEDIAQRIGRKINERIKQQEIKHLQTHYTRRQRTITGPSENW